MKYRLDAFAVNWASPPVGIWPKHVPLTVDLPDDAEPSGWKLHWGRDGIVALCSQRAVRRQRQVREAFNQLHRDMTAEHRADIRAAVLMWGMQLLAGIAFGVGIVGLLVGLSDSVGKAVG